MSSKTKFYIQLGIVVPVIIFAIIVIIASYANDGKERFEKGIRRNQKKAFRVEEVTIKRTNIDVGDGQLVIIEK